MLTYGFRLPPGPNAVGYAVVAEQLGYESIWCPEIPAFGHDICGGRGVRGGLPVGSHG